jgi:predicted signal transduction protein with EAL and GGDEF domain
VRSISAFRTQGIAPAFDIGISDWKRHGGLNELLREAESAASAAHIQGPDGIGYYDAKIAAKEERRFQLLNLLRGATERTEFTLYYQPIVSLSTHVSHHTKHCCAGVHLISEQFHQSNSFL